ncbi:MAG: selenocysteine-specific translation elongation factor [Candidatus Lokiarchaeota archaeon]|nr:selenocysteine-specific translation elongation factor [Candidatus Lokiarchaeota archaeon]
MDQDNLIPINIGLLGHIDHGKTALARVLSETISTAGLDKHKQAQERGISIDIGITSFILDDKYLITLVDAPGHADLIRSVVAASNIIDGAIVVIAADEGPKIQTGEHLLILESFDVDNVLIALNKTDLVSKETIISRIEKIRNLLKNTPFSKAPIIPVSAETNQGFEVLKKELYKMLKKPKRDFSGPFKMPLDHAFKIRGAGTVMTGTIVRGKVNVGDTIEIMPIKVERKVKTIQIFRKNKSKAAAGQRVGISIIKISPEKISRGFYACEPDSLSISDRIIIKGRINNLFDKGLQTKLQVHLTIGMPTVSGLIYPFEIINGKYILKDKILKGDEFISFVKLTEKTTVEKGMPVLISRLDIEPTNLRIVASGNIHSIPSDDPKFYKMKIKKGMVRNLDRKEGIVVEGFSDNIIGAETYIGKNVETKTGIKGKIIDTFGTKGSVLIKFDKKPKLDEQVILKKLRSHKI